VPISTYDTEFFLMPEWKNEISACLASLNLTPTREAAIIEEIAQDLDDC